MLHMAFILLCLPNYSSAFADAIQHDIAILARYLPAILIGVTKVFEGMLYFFGFGWRSLNSRGQYKLYRSLRGAILQALRLLSRGVLFCCFAISFSLSKPCLCKPLIL